mmetsp:Transcript_112354/g.317829  ORF Transcript_112354/g.317829 Transcript_112354/m.317829 type:complete len:210 (+) Transcript_112354:732-1361(+)
MADLLQDIGARVRSKAVDHADRGPAAHVRAQGLDVGSRDGAVHSNHHLVAVDLGAQARAQQARGGAHQGAGAARPDALRGLARGGRAPRQAAADVLADKEAGLVLLPDRHRARVEPERLHELVAAWRDHVTVVVPVAVVLVPVVERPPDGPLPVVRPRLRLCGQSQRVRLHPHGVSAVAGRQSEGQEEQPERAAPLHGRPVGLSKGLAI